MQPSKFAIAHNLDTNGYRYNSIDVCSNFIEV
jgi:hypothetical protein